MLDLLKEINASVNSIKEEIKKLRKELDQLPSSTSIGGKHYDLASMSVSQTLYIGGIIKSRSDMAKTLDVENPDPVDYDMFLKVVNLAKELAVQELLQDKELEFKHEAESLLSEEEKRQLFTEKRQASK